MENIASVNTIATWQKCSPYTLWNNLCNCQHYVHQSANNTSIRWNSCNAIQTNTLCGLPSYKQACPMAMLWRNPCCISPPTVDMAQVQPVAYSPWYEVGHLDEDPWLVTSGTCPLSIWGGKKGKAGRTFSFTPKAILKTERVQGNIHITQTKRRYCTPHYFTMICVTQNYL